MLLGALRIAERRAGKSMDRWYSRGAALFQMLLVWDALLCSDYPSLVVRGVVHDADLHGYSDYMHILQVFDRRSLTDQMSQCRELTRRGRTLG